MFQFFNEDQKMLQKVVRDFVEQEIAPYAAEWDDKDTCPVELFKKMGEMGMLGVFVPAQYGGAGLGLTERNIILEEVSRHSAGFGIAMMTHELAIAAIVNFGSEEQKLTYLSPLISGEKIGGLSVTEPGGGSDFGNQMATIEKTDTAYVINGRKCFITNSHNAEINVVTGTCGVNEKGRKLISAIIVPPGTPGWNAGRKEHKLGLRGSVTGDIICDNIVVPHNCIIGKDGDGSKIAMHTIGHFGRSGMSAIAVGVLRGCLEEGVKFAKERIIYGKPLSNLQSIQFIIAENKVDYDAAHAMLYNASAIYDRKQECVSDIAAVKLFSSEAAVRASKRTIDLMGGYGIINEYPVGRFLRDAMAIIPSGGTSHIMSVIIASGLTR
ncbi:MAG: acyl-CoA dehydrogenase family protein [Bacteroidales bacterium]|nr:acyl-CoA dehydrogenase family protein [Bacteroidales bacterium]HOY39254.1 acyl-CoA dehydrogenase family protein [Bacteroidales bacterium]HQP04527.1 acyl-CoA dehydrogenase family protein [Bacteroidales bacterium]